MYLVVCLVHLEWFPIDKLNPKLILSRSSLFMPPCPHWFPSPSWATVNSWLLITLIPTDHVLDVMFWHIISFYLELRCFNIAGRSFSWLLRRDYVTWFFLKRLKRELTISNSINIDSSLAPNDTIMAVFDWRLCNRNHCHIQLQCRCEIYFTRTCIDCTKYWYNRNLSITNPLQTDT